ncbi:MAG: Fic family protein [Alphaproteobacteria bacterium]
MDYKKVEQKKLELDSYRPLPSELIKNLDDWFKIELTYTSNAIEGNTLTRQETALVVEKGLTVRGKSLNEHLEAGNHAKALDFIKSLVSKPSYEITENDILNIHKIILQAIEENAGYYRSISVRISGSLVILPNPLKVPDLMEEFINNLIKKAANYHPLELASLAHYDFVTIHPFTDGNGRTARLLMNLILMQNGYPPAIIRKQDRDKYISSLETAQLGGGLEDFKNLIVNSVNRSLDIYLKMAKGEDAPIKQRVSNLLKIGQLAKLTGQNVPTIRFWTQEGLLAIAEKTQKGYSLYSQDQIMRVKEILALKKDRYSLSQIKAILSDN